MKLIKSRNKTKILLRSTFEEYWNNTKGRKLNMLNNYIKNEYTKLSNDEDIDKIYENCADDFKKYTINYASIIFLSFTKNSHDSLIKDRKLVDKLLNSLNETIMYRIQRTKSEIGLFDKLSQSLPSIPIISPLVNSVLTKFKKNKKTYKGNINYIEYEFTGYACFLDKYFNDGFGFGYSNGNDVIKKVSIGNDNIVTTNHEKYIFEIPDFKIRSTVNDGDMDFIE